VAARWTSARGSTWPRPRLSIRTTSMQRTAQPWARSKRTTSEPAARVSRAHWHRTHNNPKTHKKGGIPNPPCCAHCTQAHVLTKGTITPANTAPLRPTGPRRRAGSSNHGPQTSRGHGAPLVKHRQRCPPLPASSEPAIRSRMAGSGPSLSEVSSRPGGERDAARRPARSGPSPLNTSPQHHLHSWSAAPASFAPKATATTTLPSGEEVWACGGAYVRPTAPLLLAGRQPPPFRNAGGGGTRIYCCSSSTGPIS
jgi:hypothetical protein